MYKKLLIFALYVASTGAAALSTPRLIRREDAIKKQLNYEFYNRAVIGDQVSVIYYPAQGPLHDPEKVGHMELEVEGTCWAIKDDLIKKESFDNKVVKWHKELGLPFYRYPVRVTPQELTRLRSGIGNRAVYSKICSLNVLSDLAHYTSCKIPYPFRMSPLIAGGYLNMIHPQKGLGSVKTTNLYAHDTNRARIQAGMWREAQTIAEVTTALAVFAGVGYVACLTHPGRV